MESTSGLNREFILIAGSCGMLFLTTAITMFIYLYQRKLIKRKLAYQEIEDLLKKQELKSTYSLLEGQDIERQRIAEELHDQLGSLLSTLTMYADTLLKENKDVLQTKYVENISTIAHQANEEVRKISHQLDSAGLRHFGFQNAINDLVQVVNESKSIHIQCIIELNNELTKEIGFNLYRIIQELINNTLKHAHASEIDISITQIKNEYISVIYEDNGIGLQHEGTMTTGIGLRNIASRAEKINGQLTIGSKGKTGFNLTLEIHL